MIVNIHYIVDIFYVFCLSITFKRNKLGKYDKYILSGPLEIFYFFKCSLFNKKRLGAVFTELSIS